MSADFTRTDSPVCQCEGLGLDGFVLVEYRGYRSPFCISEAFQGELSRVMWLFYSEFQYSNIKLNIALTVPGIKSQIRISMQAAAVKSFQPLLGLQSQGSE